MAAIAAVTGTSGLRAISTFSGCGGGCLGLEMAGFSVLAASEFIPEARETYIANHPGVPVDARDIRDVPADELLALAGVSIGEIDLLEGSPPCASFSTAGKREQKWGAKTPYSGTKKQRSDDLFYEFARLLTGIQPRVFIAENVSGLVKGVAKGYYKRIFARLQEAGYVVESRLLDAQWLGVPQARQRIIFIGVRNDLGKRPVWPTPLAYRYSIADALVVGDGSSIDPETGYELALEGHAIATEWDRLQPGKSSDRYFNLVRPDEDRPAPTVTQANQRRGVAGITHPTQRRKLNLVELRRLCGFPDDFVLTGTYQQRWERLGRAVPPAMMYAVGRSVREGVFGISVPDAYSS